MIYGIRRTCQAEAPFGCAWIAFEDHRAEQQWVLASDVPTLTSSLATAQQVLAMCRPEWRCEIVQMVVNWRRLS